MQTPNKLDVHAAAFIAEHYRLDYSVLRRKYGTIRALSILALAKYCTLLRRFTPINKKPGIKPTSQDIEAWEAHKNKIHNHYAPTNDQTK